jgi:multidrug efflux pump
MAYAVIGGLAVVTVLTLVFLPSLYVAWFRVKAAAAGLDGFRYLERTRP